MAVTASQLIERLKEVEEAKTNGDLVYKLRRDHDFRTSEKQIIRWSSPTSSGPHWASAIRLLEIAGWLSPEALSHQAQHEVTQEEADQALDDLAERGAPSPAARADGKGKKPR